LHPGNALYRIIDEDESTCIECSNGEKILQPQLTYWKYIGPCYTNSDCLNHGVLYQKMEIFAEQPKRVFGRKVWEKAGRPDDEACKNCPSDCPDILIFCTPTRAKDCVIIDPTLEERPKGKPECFCHIPA
jgi:hypothetical protein